MAVLGLSPLGQLCDVYFVSSSLTTAVRSRLTCRAISVMVGLPPGWGDVHQRA